MRLSRPFALLAGVASLLALPTALPTALAAERIQVVTSFSILADMIENVGGEHVEVTALVGPDSDAHVYSPRPTDARALAEADLVVFNGLQFEGWIERLIDASDYAGPTVVATDGIEAALDEAAHGDHDHGNDHAHGGLNPHAWLDLGLGELYVDNIRDGLIAADPAHEGDYRERAADYQARIDALDAEIHALMDALPDHTAVITGHQSFNHFSRAYGVDFLSPVGLSTEAEPSAARMAELIEVIREHGVQALFQENMTSPAIIEQLAEETGLPIAGTLYSGALAAEGEADTWLGMMRHNARILHDTLAEPGQGQGGDAHGHEH